MNPDVKLLFDNVSTLAPQVIKRLSLPVGGGGLGKRQYHGTLNYASAKYGTFETVYSGDIESNGRFVEFDAIALGSGAETRFGERPTARHEIAIPVARVVGGNIVEGCEGIVQHSLDFAYAAPESVLELPFGPFPTVLGRFTSKDLLLQNPTYPEPGTYHHRHQYRSLGNNSPHSQLLFVHSVEPGSPLTPLDISLMTLAGGQKGLNMFLCDTNTAGRPVGKTPDSARAAELELLTHLSKSL